MCTFQKHSSHSRYGFTLIELSIVIVVLALMAGAALNMATQRAVREKQTSLEDGFNRIEDALMAFRKANNRLPCPANPALAVSHANFGLENGTPGTCANPIGTSQAVYGAVPTKALGLPDEAMFDSWGRKYRYLVDKRITNGGAFSTYTISDSTIGDIVIKDANGNDRTTKALVALISHGKNGHGAYLRNGTIYSGGVTNADEQNNCDCNAAGTFVNPAATSEVVQKPFLENATSPLATYDDLVRYRMRFHYPSADELKAPELSLYTGPDIITYHSGAPYFSDYTLSTTDVLTRITGPTIPSGPPPASALSFSKDNMYLAVGDLFTPFLRVYKRAGSGFNLLGASAPIFSSTMTVGADAAEWSPDGSFLAANLSASPFFRVYIKNGDTFANITGWGAGNPTVLPNDIAQGFTFSSNSQYLVVANRNTPGTGQNYHLYKISGNTFTNAAVVDTTGDGATAVDFSIGDTYLAIGSGTTGNELNIYKVNTAADPWTLTDLVGANGPDTQPAVSVNDVEFAPNNNYLAVVANAYLKIYKRNNDAFNILADPTGGTPAGNIFAAAFSSDSVYLAVAADTSPYLYVYKRTGDAFAKIADPAILPAGQVRGIAFKN